MGTHETIQQLSGHQGAIYDVTWADDQSCWLTAGGDGIIAEWAEDGSGEGRAVLHHEQAFYSVSAHQQMRVAGAENGDLFLWKRGESDRCKTHKSSYLWPVCIDLDEGRNLGHGRRRRTGSSME